MLLIRFVAAAQELKILFITSFTVPTFLLHEIPFSMKSQLLIVIDQDDIKIIPTFPYGNRSYSVNDNKLILESKRYEGPII